VETAQTSAIDLIFIHYRQGAEAGLLYNY